MTWGSEQGVSVKTVTCVMCNRLVPWVSPAVKLFPAWNNPVSTRLRVCAGDGRVHKCLREKRKQLSERCRAEELLLEEKESGSIELSVNLLKACNSERRMFCKEVQTGQARVFRCLAENMNDADFGNTCKYQIINKMQRRWVGGGRVRPRRG